MSRPLPKAGVRMARVLNVLLDADRPLTVPEIIDRLSIRYDVQPTYTTVWADVQSLLHAQLVSRQRKPDATHGLAFTVKMKRAAAPTKEGGAA